MKSLPMLMATTLLGSITTTGFAAEAKDAPLTRAQVLAELETARADGSFYAGGDGTLRGLARIRVAEHERRQQERREQAATTTTTTPTTGRVGS
jgi:hypothetical protein